MIKNYTWDINGQEDYKVALKEIELLREQHCNFSTVEVLDRDRNVVAILLEVYNV
ncbi:hypothetical protein GCM10008908_09270 [Clostridium subterminale]|uniref:Phage protein n=1 Tax=Clostridium subterminale TaxID=1550 RepID=A0ABN1KJG3_CLOSU